MSLPGTLTVPQNSALALTATVSPGNAISKNVIWSVSGGSAALYTDADCTQPLGAGASDTLTVYVKGLAMGEATVTVTATNGTDDTLDDFSAVCAVTVAASAEITYQLHDSYGDGRNGAYILVTDQETGAEITRLTVSVSDASGSFTTVPGRAIVFTWVSGSYDYECTYSLSCDGAEIFSGSDAMGAPVVYTPIVCDHELSAVPAVEPDCTQPGTAAHYHCTLCGQNFSDAEGTVRVTDAALTVPAAGHSWGEWTERADGSKIRFCTVCGASESIDAANAGNAGYAFVTLRETLINPSSAWACKSFASSALQKLEIHKVFLRFCALI